MYPLRSSIKTIAILLFIVFLIEANIVVAEDQSKAETVVTQDFLAKEFSVSVSPYLKVPEPVSIEYASRLDGAFKGTNIWLSNQQFVLLVDRNPNIQAAFLYLGSQQDGWSLLGVAPISSGLPGTFEHFLTANWGVRTLFR